MSVRVTFVRHGESVSNVAGRWQGQGDSPLSDEGRSQAARVAARLRDHAFDHVVASDLARALHTAQAFHPGARTERAFREIDVGRWEGLSRDEVLERFPEEIAALVEGKDVRIGGGESWNDARDRADRALRALVASMSPGQHAAVFSHGGVITSLFLSFVGVRSRRPQPLGYIVNTSVSTARFEAERTVIERYNDAVHLAPSGAWARKLFGEADGLVAALAWEADAHEALAFDPELTRRALDDVDTVLVAGAGATAATAERLAAVLGVATAPLEADLPLDAVGERFPARRVAVVAPAERIRTGAQHVVARLADSVHLGTPAPGSLSHLARTKGSTLLVDFNAGPLAKVR